MATLQESKKSKNNAKISQVLSYLLYYQGFLTQEDIGILLGRSKASINRYISDLLHLPDTEELKGELNMFEKQIVNFKESIYG